MEDQIKRVFLAVLGADFSLDFLKQLRAQVNVSWLVNTVNVAKGKRGDVATILAKTKCLNGLLSVFNCCVEVLVNSALNTVFFAANRAYFNFQHRSHVVGLC